MADLDISTSTTTGSTNLPPPPGAMRKGAVWLAICASCVGGFEGLRTVAYRDPIGIPTLCFGETRGVKMGDKATPEQCKAMLVPRLREFEAKLESPGCVGKAAMDRLPAKTKAAVVSLIYNTGPGKFKVKDGVCELKKYKRPSTLALRLRSGALMEACREFQYWANPPLPGIVKRRVEEANLCIEGVKEMED